MADNSAQIAALRDAIAQGTRKVIIRSGNMHREVEYHSLADMMKTLDWLEAQQSPKSRVTLAAF